MAEYPQYKINGRNISDYLESSDERLGVNAGNNYRINNSNTMHFAQYISYVHPFGTKAYSLINPWFKRFSTSDDLRYTMHKGGAPLFNKQFSISTEVSDVIIWHTGSGNIYDNGTIHFETGYSCPSSIVMVIQGSGGGGASSGGSSNSPVRSYGGGCGPLLVVYIETPYLQQNRVPLIKVTGGAGGAGGSGWGSAGANGEDTVLYFWHNSSWKKIATLKGGAGGKVFFNGETPSSGNSPAITEIIFEDDFIRNGYIFSNGDGYGKIAVNEHWRYITIGTSSNSYAYLPGNHYNEGGQNDSYLQGWGFSTPRITSGSSNYSFEQQAHEFNYTDPQSYSVFFGPFNLATNYWYRGMCPRLPIGHGGSGGSGWNGYAGGGGAGGSTGNSSNPGNGGAGGNAVLEIYW